MILVNENHLNKFWAKKRVGTKVKTKWKNDGITYESNYFEEKQFKFGRSPFTYSSHLIAKIQYNIVDHQAVSSGCQQRKTGYLVIPHKESCIFPWQLLLCFYKILELHCILLLSSLF